MLQNVEVTAKTVDEAIARAEELLKMERDDFSVEVLERGKSGFLGFGSVQAKIRVSYDDGQPEPVKEEPAVTAAPVAEEKPQQPKRIFAEEKLSGRKTAPQAAAKEGRKEERKDNRKEERRQQPKREEKVFVPEDLGEEVQDEKSQKIREFLKGLLEHMDSGAEVKVYETEQGRYKVLLEGDKLGQLIGRRGETLDAIQQLTNYCVNREADKRVRIQVDAENYRAKREDSLNRLAEKVAGKVMKYRRSVTLEPMNAYERHVIHTALQNYDHISTHSIGTKTNRRVVVSYERSKQQ